MNDWSTHLLKAEKLLRSIEDKLLHKQREGLKDEIKEAILALHETMVWAEMNPDK